MPDVKLAQGAFPEGSKVKAVKRTGDFYAPDNQHTVATATVSATDGVVFKDLAVGEYWAVGDAPGAVRFSSEDKPAEPEYTPPRNERHDPTTVSQTAPTHIVVGARGTRVGEHLVHAKPERQDEPNPHANQASVPEGTPQRSDTPLGEATPTIKNEPQPKPSQADVAKGTQQRSDTEVGEATPLSPDAGPSRQEDVGKSVRQRSATETGEATPIGSAEPRGTADNPSSIEQAEGVRPSAARPKRVQRKPAKKTIKAESKTAAKAEVKQATPKRTRGTK